MVSENALSVSLFDGTDFVLAGHIHKQQVIPGNGMSIVYCSSLKQKNFGETVSGHGFVLYDVETGGFEFVETPNKMTGFYKFSIKDLDDVDNNAEILLNP
jgi:DNA repair exonuclease SbcCD nuclease subunit